MSVKPVRSVRISGFAAALCAWAALCASAARADMYVASGNANAAAPYDTFIRKLGLSGNLPPGELRHLPPFATASPVSLDKVHIRHGRH